MLSSKLKADIRTLWDRFWSGGIANPLTAIEQITYLLFLKRLEDLDNQRAREAQEANREHISSFDNPKADEQAPATDNGRKKVDRATYRWSYIKELPSEERLNHVRGEVFDWLKTIPGAQDRMRDAVFVIPSPNLLAGRSKRLTSSSFPRVTRIPWATSTRCC